MLEHNALQTDAPLHERDDMNVDEGAIDVRIRQLVRRLQSVNGEIVGLERQLPQVPAERRHLHAAARGLFNGRHDLAAHQVSKRRTLHVQRQAR